MQPSGTLFLLPSLLGDEPSNRVLPDYNHMIMHQLNNFIVEDLRTARRFLRKAGYTQDFELVNFGILNEHTTEEEYSTLLAPLMDGKDIGLLSDAGVPCLADPGADVVRIAQRKNIRVVPLTGPSSILLALMASGFNGQHFLFHGYLPKQQQEREHFLKAIEQNAYIKDQTQIFIETPYRNLQLIESILSKCREETLLCIACNLSLESESVLTKTVKQWKKSPLPYQKKPTVFLIFHP